MKYVITQTQGIKHVLLCSDIVSHADLAKGHGEVVSAGMVDVYATDGEILVSVYGKSVTLKTEPRWGDDELIKKHLTPEVY